MMKSLLAAAVISLTVAGTANAFVMMPFFPSGLQFPETVVEPPVQIVFPEGK